MFKQWIQFYGRQAEARATATAKRQAGLNGVPLRANYRAYQQATMLLSKTPVTNSRQVSPMRHFVCS